MSWPIGIGATFKGVYNMHRNNLNLFDANKTGIERDIESELQDSTIQMAVENVTNENDMGSQEEMIQEEAPVAEETMPTGLMARRA